MDVYEFEKYLPLQTHDSSINDYIGHHFSSMVRCYENELYSSAYSHLHLLYMSYIYVQLLRIAIEKESEFEYCWIGFPNQEKDFLKNPTSPFSFALINEKPVFRFFRLLGFDSQILGEISNPVSIRNNRLHAKGDLFCDSEQEFLEEMSTYAFLIEKIDKRQLAFLNALYKSTISSYDSDYEFTSDDIDLSLLGLLSLSLNQMNSLAFGKNDAMSKFILMSSM